MLNKRVYGVLGIVSIMANWNADFSGYPKTTSTDKIFGSDKAFKYPMKRLWNDRGEKVLYIKSMRFEDNKGFVSLKPKSLKERYDELFAQESGPLDKCKDTKIVLKNLFNAIDVKNFGATFAERSFNLSITGAVQFGQGFNKYKDSYVEDQQILSPFVNPKKDKSDNKENKEKNDPKNSSIGTKIICDEAHYFYPFVINSQSYKQFEELGVTDGYTVEDYEDFKDASLCAATSFSTNAKEGCDNEFGLFVETDQELYLPNLSGDEYIAFLKGEDGKKNIIRLTLGGLFKGMEEKIFSIEIYYNPFTTIIDCDVDKARYFNIFTRKEV